MKTELLTAAETARAAEIIRNGGLVAIPTETVYGLGASALDDGAVKRIFEVKGRPQDNPLIIHVSSADELDAWCRDIPDAARRLAAEFWPGPLTMVLKRRSVVPDRVTAGLDTVAVRCPDHPAALETIRLAGVPIAAPSANLSGKPSTTTAQHCIHDLTGKVDAILDGGPCRVGVESTIVDMTVSPPRILRPGGITAEQLERAAGPVSTESSSVKSGETPRAPGMKYRHYSPKAEVTIIKSDIKQKIYDYVNSQPNEGAAVLCFDGESRFFPGKLCAEYGTEGDPSSMAERLFARLRELDRDDIERVYARCPSGEGVGRAVCNRLEKAAGGRIICL